MLTITKQNTEKTTDFVIPLKNQEFELFLKEKRSQWHLDTDL